MGSFFSHGCVSMCGGVCAGVKRIIESLIIA